MLIGFDYFNDLKNLVLNLFRLSKKKLLEIIFVLYYLPNFFHSHKGNLKVTIFKIFQSYLKVGCSFSMFYNVSRIKTVRAGELDFPQDNQASQYGLSI